MRLFEEKRVLFAVACVALALLLIFMRDLNPTTVDSNFGIEFIGGVRIPISLEKPVDHVHLVVERELDRDDRPFVRHHRLGHFVVLVLHVKIHKENF
jgi:preprotein translocase subunit SecF